MATPPIYNQHQAYIEFPALLLNGLLLHVSFIPTHKLKGSCFYTPVKSQIGTFA